MKFCECGFFFPSKKKIRLFTGDWRCSCICLWFSLQIHGQSIPTSQPSQPPKIFRWTYINHPINVCRLCVLSSPFFLYSNVYRNFCKETQTNPGQHWQAVCSHNFVIHVDCNPASLAECMHLYAHVDDRVARHVAVANVHLRGSVFSVWRKKEDEWVWEEGGRRREEEKEEEEEK